MTTLLLFVLFISITNLYYDHYQVFKLSLSGKEPINSNQRFNKIEYLDQNIGKYNGFLLGSSRMGHFPIEYVNKHAGEHKSFYNLNIFSAVPEDYLKILKYLMKSGHPIKEVIIGIDIFPLFNPPDVNRPAFRHHPNITGKSRFEYLLDYLFQTSFFYLFTEAGYYFGEEPIIYQHDYTTGRYYPHRSIKSIQENPGLYWANQLVQADTKITSLQDNSQKINPKQKEDLGKLLAWLDEQEINYKVFIQPTHPKEQALYSAEKELLMNDLKKYEIIRIKGIQKILQYNTNFYDLMHYKPVVAKAIIDYLYE